jgi:hypothetical protein
MGTDTTNMLALQLKEFCITSLKERVDISQFLPVHGQEIFRSKRVGMQNWNYSERLWLLPQNKCMTTEKPSNSGFS